CSMTLAQASSTASSIWPTLAAVSPACEPMVVTNSLISARISVDDGTCRVNCFSKAAMTFSALLHGSFGKSPDGGRQVIQHVVQILKSEDLERVSDLRDEAADFDVPALLAHLFDKAHEDAQAGGRDVIELLAVNDDVTTPGVNFALDGLLELRRGVGVHKAFKRDDRDVVL